ncbi:hypothetical protein CFC21_077836 [Triticum aestivum]|uniref:Uncharacterized protein n=3 Tax=Triticinae TaxID=1648030 RepID=A0A9R1HVI8_WHEAT|nr:hypothetical protein CFC21_077836 [Triticum aestivum]
MCVQRGRNPPGILDGLYGIQIARRPPQTQCEGEAVRTTFTDSPTCEHQNGGGAVAQRHQRLQIRRLWQQRPSCLKPIHCSITCDKHAGETFANVVTSLPFIILGLHTPRKNLNAAIYANSLVGVGIASGLYHSSRGEIRKILRWADYTMIATTTLVSHIFSLKRCSVIEICTSWQTYMLSMQCLSRAVRNENPGLLMAASTLLLPFQPFMVSAVHTGMMEASNPNDLADCSV